MPVGSNATLPPVAMVSFWRDDAQKHIPVRTAHLLSKTYPSLRWVWVVGDSMDDTEQRLQAVIDAHHDLDITLVRGDTGITAEDPANRVARLGQTANVGLAQVHEADAWVLVHESDLQSPADVVEQLLAAEKPVCGGSVWLSVNGQTVFYDTWGYRKGGELFSNHAPYCTGYDAEQPFEVDSVGSVYLFPAQDVLEGARYDQWAVVGLMRALRERGRSVWCVPAVRIVQPVDLWVSREHAR